MHRQGDCAYLQCDMCLYNISQRLAGCCHPPWKHPHNGPAHYVLPEMLYVFSLYVVAELSVLTYSTVLSPSWAANWFAASQEILVISRNPKVHYRTHKRPPTVSILGQPNPVHISTSRLLEIHPNIIHPSTPRSPQWSLSLRFPHEDPLHPPSPHPYTPHAQAISFFSILSPEQYWVRSTNPK